MNNEEDFKKLRTDILALLVSAKLRGDALDGIFEDYFDEDEPKVKKRSSVIEGYLKGKGLDYDQE